MNRSRLLRTVVVPLVIALIATLGLYRVVTQQAAGPANQDIETVSVVTAARAVPARTVITADMVAMRDVPSAFMLPGTVRSLDACIGRVTLVPLSAGESILASKITSQKPGTAGLSFVIPSGKRAMTIQVDELIGVAGFPQPGDHVDILVTYAGGGGGTTTAAAGVELRTRLLLENINILAVVQDAATGEPGGPRDLKGYTSFTLELTPEQASTVAMAERFGLLKLTLRPALDENMIGSFDVSSTSLTTPINTLSIFLERRVTFVVRVIEIENAALLGLGFSGDYGPSIRQVSAGDVAGIDAAIGRGTARVVDRATLATANRTAATYSLLGEHRPADASVSPYGLTVNAAPYYYGQPTLTVDARVALRMVDVGGQAGAVTTNVSVSASGRVVNGESLLVLGLVSSRDLALTADGGRLILPQEQVSEAMRSGQSTLIVLIAPTF